MNKKELIPEFERDASLDYIKILRAIFEIPFGVGKNLLTDFIVGDYKNSSIRKNNLDELKYFDSLNNYEKEEIRAMINNLINNGMIDIVDSNFNRFCKILRLTPKGRQEILTPTLNKKKLKNKILFTETEISEEDKRLFNELSSFLSEYNDLQKKAIISQSKKILCVAGAGTGKTTVLTKRTEFLVKYRGIEPQKILAITFTRKARQEMKERLEKLQIQNVHVETFNSFSEKILRKYAGEIYGRDIRIMTYRDKVFAIMQALNSIGKNLESAIDMYFSDIQKRNKTKEQLSNIFMNDCFFVLDYFKLKNIELYDFSEDANAKNFRNAKMIYNVCKYLKEHMNSIGLRDFTDQITDTILFFKKNNQKIPKFKHILVDEYQDVNAMQIELLKLLNPENLFCVGDPRQSIFGWRGSDINYILQFQKDYPDSETVILNKNYRSNQHIVEFMNHAIKELGLPNLEANFNGNKHIKLLEFENEQSELEFVTEQIASSDIEREEIFVLARRNRQLNELSEKLKKKNIPHILKTDEIQKPVLAKKGEITLATIHAIKGLEAKLVFVIGCNEQNFPCKASDHPVIEIIKVEDYDKEEEEKRLFYVAISRAKEKLVLTYHGKTPTHFINSNMKEIIED